MLNRFFKGRTEMVDIGVSVLNLCPVYGFFFSILPDNRLFLLLDKKRGFEKSARGRNRFSLEFHIYIFVMTHPIRGKGLTQVAKYCHEKPSCQGMG